MVATLLKILEKVRAGLEKVEECDNEIDERCEAEVIKPIQHIYQRLHEYYKNRRQLIYKKVDTIKNMLHSSLGGQI